ncbi:MAG: zinc ribbon domain-containing protein [Clostridia bacterium]|nr:zinc ribbon domain-containing protein [Clostridia bacterium]
MENLKEEIYYCTTCGAVNKKSAVFCEECKNKIIVRHRPIADFLKKRAKGNATGKVTEKLYELVKDFLFEHLYGMVLTVSVVATATTAVVTATPYISEVKTFPSETVTEIAEVKADTPDGVFEITEDDVIWLKHVITAYDAELDNTKRSGENYWSDPEEYSSATELWAENNIEGYTYSGKHELYDNPVPMGQDEYYDYSEDEWAQHYRYTTEASAKTGINVNSELGHTLLADGYDVMEVDFYALTYSSNVVTWDRFNFDALPPDGAYEKYVYTFLLTRKHGEERWHIAEEVLTERYGGPKYAV